METPTPTEQAHEHPQRRGLVQLGPCRYFDSEPAPMSWPVLAVPAEVDRD